MKQQNIELRDEEEARLFRTQNKPEPSKRAYVKPAAQKRSRVCLLIIGLVIFGLLYLVMFSSLKSDKSLDTPIDPKKDPEPKDRIPDINIDIEKKPSKDPDTKNPQPKDNPSQPTPQPIPEPVVEPKTGGDKRPRELSQTELYRSDLDKRKYYEYNLQNGMRVIAISDPEEKTSAAALSVQVGYFSDPDTVPGLAHFLEDSLKLGTKKYPKTLFETFTGFGGKIASLIEDEETNYHFQVPELEFEKAFDVFYDMFANPVFSVQNIQREARADQVEARQLSFTNKDRIIGTLGRACNKDSPFSKFPIGDFSQYVPSNKNKTESINPAKFNKLLEELKRFYETYYTPSLMSLVLVHNQPIEHIQELIDKTFGKLDAGKRSTKPSFVNSPKPFGGSYANKIIHFNPFTRDTTLNILFNINLNSFNKDVEALEFLYSYIDGSGKGSLAEYLENKEWSTRFEVDKLIRTSNFEIANFEIVLTEEGVESIEDVIKATFAYLDYLKTTEIRKDLFEQFAEISENKFTYDQYPAGEDDASTDIHEETARIASNLRNYPLKYALSGDRVLHEYDKENIKKIFDQFSVENVLFTFSSPKYNKPAKKPVDGSKRFLEEASMFEIAELDEKYLLLSLNYAVKPIPANFLESLKKVNAKGEEYTNFREQKKTIFVPQNFDIKTADPSKLQHEKTVKKIIDEDQRISAWHIFEGSVNAPFITCYIRFNHPEFQTNPAYVAASGIWGSLIQLSQPSIFHGIEQGGNHVTYSPREIKIEAWSERLKVILSPTLRSFKKGYVVNKGLFDDAKDDFMSRAERKMSQYPEKIAEELNEKLLGIKEFSIAEIDEAANNLSVENFKTILSELMENQSIEVFFYGNLLEADALSYVETIKEHTGYSGSTKNDVPQLKIKDIDGKNIVFRTQLPGRAEGFSLTSNYYQGGEANAEKIAMLNVLVQILKPMMISDIKKRIIIPKIEQEIIGKVYGVRISAQTALNPKSDINDVDREIENFLTKAEESLREFDQAKLEEIMKGYEQGLAYDKKSYRIKGDDLYEHFRDGDKMFNIRDEIKKEIPKITKEKLQDFYTELFGRSKLSVQLFSEKRKTISDTLLSGESQYNEIEPVLVKEQADFERLFEVST